MRVAIDAVRASAGGITIPAVGVTADPSDTIRRRAAKRGVGYRTKPVRIERLRSPLAHLLRAASTS